MKSQNSQTAESKKFNTLLIHQIIDDIKKMYVRHSMMVQDINDRDGKLLVGANLLDA